MVATNDEILAELKRIKNILKGTYKDISKANEEEAK